RSRPHGAHPRHRRPGGPGARLRFVVGRAHRGSVRPGERAAGAGRLPRGQEAAALLLLMRGSAGMARTLLIRPGEDARTPIRITPQDAGWEYVSCSVHLLLGGEAEKDATGGTEVSLVLQGGRATVRSSEDARTPIRITRQDAGWEYVSYSGTDLRAGEALKDATGGEEVGLVLLGGRATVRSSAGAWENIGGRQDVFDGLPWAVYLPPGVE